GAAPTAVCDYVRLSYAGARVNLRTRPRSKQRPRSRVRELPQRKTKADGFFDFAESAFMILLPANNLAPKSPQPAYHTPLRSTVPCPRLLLHPLAKPPAQ